jgi:excinuclease ABC subunit B
VAILDADKEGFLRSRTSLIQTMGRAARNVDSLVLLYADTVTGSMQAAIDEVERRREIQIDYNKKHHVTPRSIEKIIRKRMVEKEQREEEINYLLTLSRKEVILPDEKEKIIKRLTKEMRQAAQDLDFETATILRDQVKLLRN